MITGLHHFGLLVDDLEDEAAFYASLGFVELGRFASKSMGAKAVMMQKSRSAIEIWKFDNPLTELAQKVKNHIALSTDNLESDIKVFLDKNCELAIPIDDGKLVKRYAYVKDPSGNYIELCEPLSTVND